MRQAFTVCRTLKDRTAAIGRHGDIISGASLRPTESLICCTRAIYCVLSELASRQRVVGHLADRCAQHAGAARTTKRGVDLSLMKGIRVDPNARTVWAQGGALWPRALSRRPFLISSQ